jgi:hypothetical protein
MVEFDPKPMFTMHEFITSHVRVKVLRRFCGRNG